MKPTGTNTATIENVVAATASPISSVPSCDARRCGPSPSRRGARCSRARRSRRRSGCRSRATGPSSDMVFSVKPKSHSGTNDASTDTGSASPVMTVERHELRKRKTTSTVRIAPSTSASSTSAHRVAHALAGVAHDLDRRPRRQRRAERRRAAPSRRRLTVRRAVALRLHDVEPDRLAPVVQRGRAPLGGAGLAPWRPGRADRARRRAARR